MVTVEGLADGDELHAVQRAFVEAGAVQCGFCTPGLVVAIARPARRATRARRDPEIREALAGNLCRCTGYEKILDAVRLAARRGRGGAHDLVIEGCAIATVDAAGTEHADGHLVVDGDRIVAVGAGAAPAALAARRAPHRRRAAASPRPASSTATTTSTSGRPAACAQQATLFEWLAELYPVWAHIDDEIEWAAARAGLAALARSGCTTVDRPPLRLPARRAATCSAVEVDAARERSACASTRAAARWTSAAPTAGCRPTRSSRTATRSSPPARPRSTASTTRRPARWCGSRSRRARRSRSPAG